MRESFVQSLPICSNLFHLWKKFHGAELCLIAQSLHVCDRKILIKSDAVINIRFIIHFKELYNEKGNIFFNPPYLFILVNPRDLGRHTLLKVSFMHGLGVITTWVIQLFIISMMIS